jgi:hypothetical protein
MNFVEGKTYSNGFMGISIKVTKVLEKEIHYSILWMGMEIPNKIAKIKKEQENDYIVCHFSYPAISIYANNIVGE